MVAWIVMALSIVAAYAPPSLAQSGGPYALRGTIDGGGGTSAVGTYRGPWGRWLRELRGVKNRQPPQPTSPAYSDASGLCVWVTAIRTAA